MSVQVTTLWASLALGRGMESLGPVGVQGWWGSWRQSCPERVVTRKGNLSVELAGAVKWSSTVFPMRWAVRSWTGWGKWREGARGGAGLAHPARISAVLRAR